MSYYKKFVSYIDLYEYEEKVKNIGFMKSEIKDQLWKIKVNIRGLETTDTIMCEMKTVGAEEFLDRFQIVKGEGQFEREYEMEHLAGTNITYTNVHGIIFQLSSHKYGKCTWVQDNHTYHASEEKQGFLQTLEQKRSISVQAAEQKHLEEEKQPMQEKSPLQEKPPLQENQKQNDNVTETKSEKSQNVFSLPEYQLNNISGNKWMQLGRMYPSIHPFHEKEKGEYISLKPKDFVILHEKYQTLVNNSFLLHGFFNYRHIILGKKMEGQSVKYYIGVPGTFHEREKMVAIMFGFEEFEGVDSEERGAFGYYMKEVKI